MNYRLIKQIPTMLGATVHIAESDAGQKIIVKQADIASERTALQAYVRHLRTMHELLGEDSVYPAVLYHDDNTLILPFFERGSLDDLMDKKMMHDLTTKSIDSLFKIAAMPFPVSVDQAERREMSQNYIVNEATRRLHRLEDAIKNSRLARDWATQEGVDQGVSPNQILEPLTAWIRDGNLALTVPAIAAPSLGLAAHGDLGLNNVLCASATSATPIKFIDIRGRWHYDFPWWDPIMDLATLLAFHCRIEPALATLTASNTPVIDKRPRLSESEILAFCADSQGFQAWVRQDPAWRERLEINLAIRIFGNISINLLIAPRHRAERATILLKLFVKQMQRVREIVR